MSRVLLNKSNLVTQPYKKETHKGIDIVGEGHTVDYIIAHENGEVTEVRKDYNRTDKTGSSYGNYVKIKHDGYYTLYAHLKYGSINVNKGDYVYKGQVIGFMGATGRSTGAHLHFEIRTSSTIDSRIDPTPYINANYISKDCFNEEDIIYSVYDNAKNKWLNSIHSQYGTGILSYAGNYGNSISGLKIENKQYRVHDKVKNKWLNWITGTTGSGIMSYAGNLGNPIDGVQIVGCEYRVHLKRGDWLSWIDKVDDTNQGYAGIYGREIDAIQIRSCS